ASPAGGVAPIGSALLILFAAAAAALPGRSLLAADAERCRSAIIEENAWTCAGAGTFEFVEAARWAGGFLPADAVVLSRKPRIFHVESGLPSRTYPFLDDPGALFDAASRIGARYVILDRVAPQGMRFVGGALVAHPERFCSIRSFRVIEGGSTELLGILPGGEPGGSVAGPRGIELARCPDGYRRERLEVVSDPRDRVPILRD
ncbi:MAG: hypothetical protein RQ745_11895, partial [Longimicrobiales bacterium]|nr:hypothetical protein [Longimicrobiales bacterium]